MSGEYNSQHQHHRPAGVAPAEGKVIFEYHDVLTNDLEGGSRRCTPVEHSKF
jgi:hypothetical protein